MKRPSGDIQSLIYVSGYISDVYKRAIEVAKIVRCIP